MYHTSTIHDSVGSLVGPTLESRARFRFGPYGILRPLFLPAVSYPMALAELKIVFVLATSMSTL